MMKFSKKIKYNIYSYIIYCYNVFRDFKCLCRHNKI